MCVCGGGGMVSCVCVCLGIGSTCDIFNVGVGMTVFVGGGGVGCEWKGGRAGIRVTAVQLIDLRSDVLRFYFIFLLLLHCIV